MDKSESEENESSIDLNRAKNTSQENNIPRPGTLYDREDEKDNINRMNTDKVNTLPRVESSSNINEDMKEQIARHNESQRPSSHTSTYNFYVKDEALLTVQNAVEGDLLDKSPPDFDLAMIHRMANMVKNINKASVSKRTITNKNEFCPCWQLPTFEAAPKYSLWMNFYDFIDLGSGIPLYFYFMKYLLVIYFIMIFIVTIPGTILLSREDKGEEWGDSSETFQTELTLGNFGKSPSNHEATEIDSIIILNSAVILIVYILNFLFRNYQRSIVRKIDELNVTPGDFAVMVNNLPYDKTKNDILNWINEIDPDLIISEINLCYDIKKVIYKIRKLYRLNKIKSNFDKYKGKLKYDEVCEMIDEYNKEIQVYKDQIDADESSLKYQGRAFIIFEKQSHAEKVLWHFQMHWIVRLCYTWFRWWKLGKKVGDKRVWEGKLVEMKRAAEPIDIFWENLGFTFKERLKFRIIPYLVTLLLLGFVFGVTFGLKFLISDLEKNTKGSSDGVIWIVWLLAFVNSTFISSINFVLRIIMRMLTLREKHRTYTDYDASVWFKLFVAMFLNTAIIPLWVNSSRSDWFSDGGLVVEIYLNVIIVSFANPFFYYYNWTLLWKKYKIWKEKKNGIESKMTQREANLISEGTNFDIAKGYADVIMIFGTTAFYTPLIPLLPAISMLGLVFHYWLQKYILFRKWRIPQHMGEGLAMQVTTNIPFIMFLYALGQYIFITKLSEAANYICIPIMIFWIIYYIVPKDVFLQKCENKVKRDDDETYSKNKLQFILDYDRSNPLTVKEATLKHLDELAKMENDEDKLSNIKTKRLEFEDKTLFDNLTEYSENHSLDQRVKRIYGHGYEKVEANKENDDVFNYFIERAKELNHDNASNA